MKVYTQYEGIFICGKIKEVQRLLAQYKNKRWTVRELIMGMSN
ncbi:MAG: hypothetical protein PHP51_00500 [Desulfotomaculaceae bacterium]|nr:hypothetical protein [Desulfotomaculaceae bacterium]MDD4766059.1 hypothetical protein [Desulfotomaculaceae bacterium]